MTFNKSHTTFVFLLLATAFTGVVAGNGPKGVRAQKTIPLSSHRRLDDKVKVKGPSKRDCKVSKKSDEVDFECETKEDDAETEIKDNINFQVRIAEGEGLTVKVKYEKKVKTQDIKPPKNETEVETQEIEAQKNDTEIEQQNDKVKDEQMIETQEAKTETKTQYDKVDNEQEIVTQSATESETETQYDVKFDRVIEYRKADVNDTGSSDEDMAYEWDVDSILQEIPLTSWQNFSSIVEEEGLSKFSIATQDNSTTFIFTIARGNSGNITANKMKIDFKLTNFPWMADDTFVALLCTVESKAGRKVGLKLIDDSGNEAPPSPGNETAPPRPTTSRKTKDVMINFADALDTTSVTPFGEFDWADTAEVMGTTTESTTIEVVATSPASELSNDIAFSFVGSVAHRAAGIYWDPTAGVAYESGSGAGALSFMGVASLGLVALVSMM